MSGVVSVCIALSVNEGIVIPSSSGGDEGVTLNV